MAFLNFLFNIHKQARKIVEKEFLFFELIGCNLTGWAAFSLPDKSFFFLVEQVNLQSKFLLKNKTKQKPPPPTTKKLLFDYVIAGGEQKFGIYKMINYTTNVLISHKV